MRQRTNDRKLLDAQYVRRGALPVAEACDYIRQAAIGLQHAHERGMVHRDIKPHNMMAENPDDRFQTPAEVAAALQPFCQSVEPQKAVETRTQAKAVR